MLLKDTYKQKYMKQLKAKCIKEFTGQMII